MTTERERLETLIIELKIKIIDLEQDNKLLKLWRSRSLFLLIAAADKLENYSDRIIDADRENSKLKLQLEYMRGDNETGVNNENDN